MIEVHNLVKKYGTLEAVRDVSFNVGSQQVLGFLGPNGAGKTTIMKILTGYHFPSGGRAVIDGRDVQEEPVAVKNLIGYLPESVPLYGELTIDEYLAFVADARHIEKTQRPARINAALDACGLTHMRTRRIETLSKGYKQRTGLAQAILHDPPILILDEPTSGLDPNQIIEIRTLIKELGKSKTVILSTHILQEVEAVCSNVLILNEGRIAAQGTPEAIAGSMRGGETWVLVLRGGDLQIIRGRLEALEADFSGLMEVNSVTDGSEGTVEATFFIKGEGSGENYANAERIFDWAASGSLKILQMNRKKISLEDIFVKLTSEAA
ncbi:multidrug ABC transporter ATP-binding protein [Spirochaetia bacterium]|nr:multidrug ABC transporter ATP-binding protein [Spirochaetia bacterium]